MRLNVKNPRKIFDRKAFVAQLAGLANAEPDADFTTPKLRSAVLALYKQQLALGHGEIQRRFEAQEASGAGTLRAGAYLLDQIILSLLISPCRTPTPNSPKKTWLLLPQVAMDAAKLPRNLT